jgi:hypothetical protein
MAAFSFHDFCATEQTVSGGAAMRNVEKEIVDALTFREKLIQPPIITDPNGSYTGRPRDLDEKPVQDADDL